MTPHLHHHHLRLKLNHQKLATFTAANPETGQKLKSVLSSDLIDYLKKIPFLKDLPSSKLVSNVTIINICPICMATLFIALVVFRYVGIL
jgi:hypothetical protein